MTIQPIPESRRTPRDTETLGRDEVEIYTMDGVEGPSVVINDRRVAGPKAWGGGEVTEQWTARKRDVLAALALEEVNSERQDCAREALAVAHLAHGNLDALVFGNGADPIEPGAEGEPLGDTHAGRGETGLGVSGAEPEHDTWPPPKLKNGVEVWAVDQWIPCRFRDGEWRFPSGAVIAGGRWRRRVVLPAHEDGPDEVPSPWAAAAKALRLRIGAASLRVDSILGRLPTPGCTDEEDLTALEQFTQALEDAVRSGERLLRLRDERRQAERLAKKLERAADALKV